MLGHELKLERIKARVMQKTLAKRMKVCPEFLSMIENDKFRFSKTLEERYLKTLSELKDGR